MPCSPFARIGSTCLLCAYVVALSLGTHWPVLPDQLFSHTSDKTLHFLSYAGLGVLSALRLFVYGQTRQAVWWGWLAALILAGGLDEGTQPIVGRIADLGDWIADSVGAIVGLAFGVVALRCGWSSSFSRSAQRFTEDSA
jgi:VanZ family protein